MEQTERITALLVQRDYEGVMDLCESADLDYGQIVMMLVSVCSTMMPKVTGDTREHPLDMWVMEPTAFGAVPTRAMQLLVAFANGDDAMAKAHLSVIMETAESAGQAAGELAKMAADLLNIWVEQQGKVP